MALHETLRAAFAAGVELWLDAGRLHYRSQGPLPAALKAQLTAHKPAIIALLVAQGVGKQDDYGMFDGEPATPKRYPFPRGCIAQGACVRLGWCWRALDALGCDMSKEPVEVPVTPVEEAA